MHISCFLNSFCMVPDILATRIITSYSYTIKNLNCVHVVKCVCVCVCVCVFMCHSLTGVLNYAY